MATQLVMTPRTMGAYITAVSVTPLRVRMSPLITQLSEAQQASA
jgi:hypothetical protein